MTAPQKSAKDFLNSGGVRRGPKLLAWGQYRIGDSVVGIIIEPEPYVTHVTKMGSKTGEKDTWDDGSIKEQLIISIDTGVPDPHIEGHDGKWGLAIKGGWKVESAKKALTLALQDAGAEDGPEVGDWIKMTRLPNAKNTFGTGTHQFTCEYCKAEDFGPEQLATLALVNGDGKAAAKTKRAPAKKAVVAADDGAWEG